MGENYEFQKLMAKFDTIILSRTTKLVAKFLNKTVKVHNGKKYHEFFITENMLGLKIGCFSTTRKTFVYKKK